jgi:hypothetical protein
MASKKQHVIRLLSACCLSHALSVLPARAVQDEGVCTVKWEDGVSEESIYIGQHGIFSLVTLPDDAAPRSVSSGGPEGVRPQSLAPADTAQSNTAHGAQKVLDPSRSRGHSSHGGRPEYQPMVHEKERASHASSPEVLGEPLRPRSLSPDQLAHRVGALDDARRDDVRKCLEQLCATSPNSSPRPQQRVSYHQWAQGTSGEYADTTVGMGIVGVFVEYVTLFGPASNSGKVQEGDQILSVEGESVGIDPDRLVRLISAHRGAKPLVRITVNYRVCVYVCTRVFGLSAQTVLLHNPECGLHLISEYKGSMPIRMLSYHVAYQTMLGMHLPIFTHADLCGCMGAAMPVCLVPVQTCALARTKIYASLSLLCVCAFVRCTAKCAGNNWRWTLSDGLDRNCKCTRLPYVYKARLRAHVDEFQSGVEST